jgi:hypothetical protein
MPEKKFNENVSLEKPERNVPLEKFGLNGRTTGNTNGSYDRK